MVINQLDMIFWDVWKWGEQKKHVFVFGKNQTWGLDRSGGPSRMGKLVWGIHARSFWRHLATLGWVEIPCAISKIHTMCNQELPHIFYHWILNHERIPSSWEPGFAREFKWWPIQWVSMHICYLIFIHINALLHIWLSLMLCLKVLAPKEKPTGSTSVEDPETVSWHNCQIWGKYYGHFLGWLQVIISLIAC